MHVEEKEEFKLESNREDKFFKKKIRSDDEAVI